MGDQIVGSLDKNFAADYTSYFEEGGLYTITNFSVDLARPNYRVVANDLTLAFLQNTSVKPVSKEEFTFPFHRFSVVPYRRLSERVGPSNQLPDLVGRLLTSTNIELVGLQKDLNCRTITLEDVDHNRIAIALFGKKADLITENDLTKSPMLVVTSVQVKMYLGKISVSSSTATRIFRDPDVPETKSYALGVDAVPRGVPIVSRPSRPPTYEELREKQCNLLELACYCDDPGKKEAVFYASAKITRVLLKTDWKYPACDTHNTRVSTVDNKFECPDCNGEPTKTSLRFRLELEGQDPHAVVVFTLFNKEAAKLLNVCAADLALEYSDGIDPDCMPEPMRNLLGLDLLFCVKVTDFNFRTSIRSFTVLHTYPSHDIPKAPPHVDTTSGHSPALEPLTPIQKGQRTIGKHSVSPPTAPADLSSPPLKRSKCATSPTQECKALGKQPVQSALDSDTEDPPTT